MWVYERIETKVLEIKRLCVHYIQTRLAIYNEIGRVWAIEEDVGRKGDRVDDLSDRVLDQVFGVFGDAYFERGIQAVIYVLKDEVLTV